jgi:hypothetical protein
VLGVLGVSRPLRKFHSSMPKLLDASVVAITKNGKFFKNLLSKDDLGHKNNFLKTFFYRNLAN